MISNKQIRYGDQRSASSSTNSNKSRSRPVSRGRYFLMQEAEDVQGLEIDPEYNESGVEGAEGSDSNTDRDEEFNSQFLKVLAQLRPRASSQPASRGAMSRPFGSQPRPPGAVVPTCIWCKMKGHWWQHCVSLRSLWDKLVKDGAIAPPSMRGEREKAKSDASEKAAYRVVGVVSGQEGQTPLPEDALEQLRQLTGVPALPVLDHLPDIAGRVTN